MFVNYTQLVISFTDRGGGVFASNTSSVSSYHRIGPLRDVFYVLKLKNFKLNSPTICLSVPITRDTYDLITLSVFVRH